MVTVNDLIGWVDKIANRGLSNKYEPVFDQEEDTGAKMVRLNLFTQHHRYAIKAIESSKGKRDSYLGCIVYNRTPYAGEHHFRSSDLADGSLSKVTWEWIKDDILAHELVNLGAATFNPCRS